MHIALAGLPGSGKSTVAVALAARLGVGHIDVDAEVGRRVGCSVREVFVREGEAAFRRRELAVLEDALAGDERSVIACGAGLFPTDAGRAALIGRATTVVLDAPDAVLLARLGDAHERPLLAGNPRRNLRRLRALRADAHATADRHVDANGPVAAVVTRVLAAVGEGDLWVDVPGRRHPVLAGAGAASALEYVLPERARRVAVIADRAVAPLARRLAASVRRAGRSATLILMDGGEPAKTWAVAGRLVRRLATAGLSRDDCVVVAGGGTIGDLAGFVAAVYMRGIAVIQVPTTLLAMVDSSIGGKTGVNLPSGKNLAGSVWQPHAVLCDLDALATLPVRARRAALSEIIKCAMVVDNGLGDVLDRGLDALIRGDAEVTAEVVRRCIDAKAGIVAGDEREAGRRALLNYGHTVGHAMESMTRGELWHGEAVAVGMRVAGLLSIRFNGCPPDDVRWQDGLLDRSGLDMRPALNPDAVVAGTAIDKKSSGGRVRWVLADRRGHGSAGHALDDAAVRDAVVDVLGHRTVATTKEHP